MVSTMKRLIAASIVTLTVVNAALAAPAWPVAGPSYGWMERDSGGKSLTL
jgi:hypothetical protein